MTKSLFVLTTGVLSLVASAPTVEAQRPATAPDATTIVGVVTHRGPLTWGPAPAGAAHAPRERTFHVQHQTISVSFDWTRHAVVGSTTLRIAAMDKSLERVDLDAVGMKLGAVTDEAR